MVLGFISVPVFTVLHVIISLIAIVAGFIAMGGMLASKKPDGWTTVFLVTTVLTSVTGFMFPINGFTPALGTGIVSSIVLIVALLAFYAYHLEGVWRSVYVVTAVAALYLNVFVLVVQSFLKIPPLKAIAPTGSEPPFVVVQGFALIGCIALSTLR